MAVKIRDFKDYEVYSQLRVPKNIPFFIRCDGRGFHRLTSTLNFKKPYDEKLAKILVNSAKEIFSQGFNVVLAYVFSDEINLLFINEEIFNRRVEKLVSIIPSIISSKFTIEAYKLLGKEVVVSFDARIIPLAKEEILDYLVWRQSECFRNCINSYAYYVLINSGYTPHRASNYLRGKKAKELIEVISKFGRIKIDEIPLWHKRGVLIYWKLVEKEGFNPIKRMKVKVLRKVLVEDWNLPEFSSEEGKSLIASILSTFSS